MWQPDSFRLPHLLALAVISIRSIIGLHLTLKQNFTFILVLTYSLLTSISANATNQTQTSVQVKKANQLVDNGGYIVTHNADIIAQLNPNTSFVPASIFKIITAAAALKILGPGFRFTTELYQNNQGNLFIKGLGDPFLVSEEVHKIIAHLATLHILPIQNIFIDNSYFLLNSQANGNGISLNPYDAINTALAVNFNTLKVLVKPDGQVLTGEKQTPHLQIMNTLAKNIQTGSHRISISSNKSDAALYAGQLFSSFALTGDININSGGTIKEKNAPAGLAPLYVHSNSKTLAQVLESMMLYSNNYIANQVFLAIGARQFGSPGTWEKGQRAVRNFLKEHNISTDFIHIIEGSGLSRQNTISPKTMINILNLFKPYAHILPHEKGRYIKSGTLNGVYSYAGYFINKQQLDPFVLILNQPKNKRNQLIKYLHEIWKTSQ